LAGAGYPVVAIAGRTTGHAKALADRIPDARAADSVQEAVDAADVVFLTVPDDAIAPLARGIAWPLECSAVHCSGVASVDLLAPAIEARAQAGVFHPLQTFATAAQAERNMPGSAFGIEATADDLLAILGEMAEAIGGTPIEIAGEKAIYHASAVVASNYTVTLLDIATGLWEALGLSREDGLKALLPLVRGTIENLDTVGLPQALTGPIARGDTGTIARHLDALGRVAPEILPVYKELARRTIPIARARGGLADEAAERLREILDHRTEGGDPCE
jgi:predicted short-subunit dehydrogenase-like oxidoreductase (DUF2520 family)